MSNFDFNNEDGADNQVTGVPLTKRERRRLKREEKRAKREVVVRSASRGRWAWWLLALLVIVGAVYGLYRIATRPVTPGAAGNLSLSVNAEDWRRGPVGASAVLVEYSDFQCPACSAYEPLLQQLSKDFPDDLAVIYRHFPLRQTHLNAEWSARAAEAAGRQGKFWEMHDLLFTRQTSWAERLDAKTVFTDYAQELKLDPARFKKDLNSSEAKSAVEADYQSGLGSKVAGTPTLFLNGQRITNPSSYEAFAELIKQTAASSTVTAATSTDVNDQ